MRYLSLLLALIMLCTPLSAFAASWTELPTTPYKAGNETPEDGDILVLFERDFESDTVGKAAIFSLI